MKKFLSLLMTGILLVFMTACGSSTPEQTASLPDPAADSSAGDGAAAPDASTGTKKIGAYLDAADDYYRAGFEVFAQLASEEGWEVQDIVGQGTAPEQISAIENFITNKVDAILVYQNSPQASAECLAKADEAGIPVFFCTHTPPDEPGLGGFAGYDFVYSGKLAAASAIKHDVKRVVMIEGKLGQGTASGQTEGFITGYKEAGKDVGDAMNIGGKGGEDLQIVFWASGGWFADPAKKAMQDAITTLGPDGFDGAYVQNDEMMDGAIQAFEEAGLNPSDYWLGSSNGKEKSWQWVEDGKITMDVNQTPSLEADLVFQMIKANLAGQPYKKCVFSSMIPYEKADMDVSTFVPYDKDAYFEKRAAGAFVYDLNDDRFQLNPAFKQ